jgi:hypothetical protein
MRPFQSSVVSSFHFVAVHFMHPELLCMYMALLIHGSICRSLLKFLFVLYVLVLRVRSCDCRLCPIGRLINCVISVQTGSVFFCSISVGYAWVFFKVVESCVAILCVSFCPWSMGRLSTARTRRAIRRTTTATSAPTSAATSAATMPAQNHELPEKPV